MATLDNSESQHGFDGYYTWLGIPPRDQPPNFYRLLGIENFETNVDVISNAADRQMAHLRAQATGPRQFIAQKLLTEIAIARHRLLDREQRAEYDASLKRQLSSGVRPIEGMGTLSSRGVGVPTISRPDPLPFPSVPLASNNAKPI